MSTKLRSACDKCHETKVRCSGDIPCQGCLTSRSLCFYSVSNPLGRPRGTKKKPIRGGSAGNNTWDAEDGSKGEATVLAAGTTKRTRTRQSLVSGKDNNEDGSSSTSRTHIVSNGNRESTSDPMGSGGPAPGDNASFIPGRHGQNNVSMSDMAAPNEFRLNSLSPSGNETQGHSDPLPHSFDFSNLDRYRMSDIARADFGSLANPNDRNLLTWDDSTYIESESSSDLLRTSAENLNYSNTFKVKKIPSTILHCVTSCRAHCNHDKIPDDTE